MERRECLRLGAAVAASAFVGSSLWSQALADPAQGGPGPYGPLLPADANGIMLPEGFVSRVIAHAQEEVGRTGYVWPIFPDGGATYRTSGGWIYVANSEFVAPGGVSAVRFNQRGDVVDAYSICTDTFVNCAGGRTPWNTWLTCEEVAGGNVWECDPTGRRAQIRRPALGTFKHEAAAVDPRTLDVYLTEDEPDGRLYRFVPTRRRSLEAGELQVAVVRDDGLVDWVRVPEPNPAIPGSGTPTRHQVEGATVFPGGEGIVYDRGRIFVTTKGNGRVSEYDIRSRRLTIAYDPALDPLRQLTGVDNITASRSGDLVVAEDGGNMELVLLTPSGVASPIVRVVGQEGSELAGPAFDPSGRRLYFSSQRADGVGITYEVSGPFRRSAPVRRGLPRIGA
jgi:secreted PhoX family phosphatase